MKTNITIASNIFIRKEDNIRNDSEFVAQVRGRVALKKLQEQYGSLSDGIKLSDWQKKMLMEGTACSYAKNGEMTHGPVRKNDKIIWEGRCEYSSCQRYGKCKEIFQSVRTPNKITVEENEMDTPLTYEWLGSNEILVKNSSEEELPSQEVLHEEAFIENISSDVIGDDYKKIDNSDCIVEDIIESKILVNAAPGSGKTYTAMRRLEYIVHHDLVEDLSNILVLVYTNAAKYEIIRRLDLSVKEGKLPYSAKSIDICTFDSLASSYLSAIDAEFSHLDYNGRIKLFNEKFVSDDFSNFEYVIIDELQDLVNERAKMALNILGALTRGFLLLGDKCQAIYDYDCHDGSNVSSVEFYKRLKQVLPIDIKKYELLGNRRQIDSIAMVSDTMRSSLLEGDPYRANISIANELRNIETVGDIDKFDFNSITQQTAILCRNNGEAEYVSHLLNKAGIRHNFLRSVGQTVSLHRLIADCLWDYHKSLQITEEEFIERYCARVSDNEKEAKSIFESLSEIVYGKDRENIELEKLAQSLSKPMTSIDEILINRENALITVSTIHKAKGREFDVVYLLDDEFNATITNMEEARVWYVGCTRARCKLLKFNKINLYLKHSDTYTNRWIQLKNHRVKWSRQLKSHCCRIAIGLPRDLDKTGFVKGDFIEALKIQEYIAEKIHVGDRIDLVLTNKKYEIRHKGNLIGYLTDNIYNQLFHIVRESNPSSKEPPLSSAYVSNIVTVIPDSYPEEVVPYFRESKFWLGVEITGFPEINWKCEQSNDKASDL